MLPPPRALSVLGHKKQRKGGHVTDVEARGCLETRRGYIHYHVSETAWQCRTEYLENSAVCRILNGYSLFI